MHSKRPVLVVAAALLTSASSRGVSQGAWRKARQHLPALCNR